MPSDNPAMPLQPGMTLIGNGSDRMDLQLDNPVGSGIMSLWLLAGSFAAAVVDFHCERCPNIARGTANFAPNAPGDALWFTVNLCLEGRCEVFVPGSGFAVVKEGDCCISCTDDYPEDYRYPTGRYRGIELLVRTDAGALPSLGLLGEAGVDLRSLAGDAGFAAVFSQERVLNSPLETIGATMAQRLAAEGPAEGPAETQPIGDEALLRARILSAFMEFMLALASFDVREARPGTLLTRSQIALAEQARNELEGDLALPHDTRAMARKAGVSAATLNGYFAGLYGTTIASYLRRRRVEEAGRMLARGASVTEAALAVGYANPSKFAAAFKRITGLSPSEFRRSKRSETLRAAP